MQPCSTLPFLAVLLSVGNGGGTQVELRTEKSVNSNCQNKVTLNCTIITEHSDFFVLEVRWEKRAGEKLCKYSETSQEQHSDPRIQCHYRPKKELSLTISNLSEADQDQYVCKLFTLFNHTKAVTTLHVSECLSETIMRGSYSVQTDNNRASPLQIKWTFLVLTAFMLSL